MNDMKTETEIVSENQHSEEKCADQKSTAAGERERVGASAPNTLSHAHRALARDTYLDYIHTTQPQISEDNSRETKNYSHKVIISGDIIESYKYHRDHEKNISDESEKKEKEQENDAEHDQKSAEKKEDDEEYQRKLSTIYRTRTNLKRLINANIGQYKERDKFITLTFADYLERDQVINCFQSFIRRLRRRYENFEFIAVIERGTKSTERLHLHTLFFGLPFIPADEFVKIWKYGTIDIKAIEDYNEIANYILKYIEKTLTEDNYIPKGKKFYITSRGLKRPDTLYLTKQEFEELMEQHTDKLCVFTSQLVNKSNLEFIDYAKFRKVHDKDIGWIKPQDNWTDTQRAEYEEYMAQVESDREEMERFGLTD